MLPVIRTIWYALWGVIAGFIILAALLFSVVRLTLPFAADYKLYIEQRVSQLVGREVTLSRVKADWRHLTPRLRLQDIRVSDPRSQGFLFEIDEIVVDVDLLGTLVSLTPEFSGVDIIGTHIEAIRDEKNRIFIQGLSLDTKRNISEKTAALPEFFNNKVLRLLKSSIRYQDKILHLDYSMQEISLVFVKQNDVHQLFISTQMPEPFGKRLELGVNFHWDSGGSENLHGEGYIRGEGVQLASFANLTAYKDRIQQGSADTQLWFDIEDGDIVSITGQVRLVDVSMNVVGSSLPLNMPQLDSRFLVHRQKNGFIFIADELALQAQQDTWRTSGITASFSVNGQKQIDNLQLRADAIWVANWMPFIQFLPDNSKKTLEKMIALAPDGIIRKLVLRWQQEPGRDFFAGLSLSLIFEEFGVKETAEIPSISGLKGRLLVKHPLAELSLDSHDAEFVYNRLFREPIHIPRLSGKIYFITSPEKTRIRAEHMVLNLAHMETESQFALDIRPNVSPYFVMSSRFKNGDGRYKSRYLPVGIMNEKLITWLDEGVRQVSVTEGEFEFKGHFSDFPFRDKQGIFRIEFDFEDAELLYKAGWPVAAGISGKALFEGPRFAIDIYSGRIYDAAITNVAAGIKDYRKGVLDIELVGLASLQTSLRFVRESPLKTIFSPVIDDVEGNGYQATTLKLNIPLNDSLTDEFLYSGETKFYHPQLKFPEWGLDFSGINAPFYYKNRFLEMAETSARLNGRDIRLGIITEDDNQGLRLAVIKTSGIFSLQDLMRKQPTVWMDRLQGESAFEALLQLPLDGNDEEQKQARLIVRSELEGVAFDLPAPLGKSREERAYAIVESRFLPDSQAEINVAYSNWLNARLILGKNTHGVQVHKADIRLHDGPARLDPFEGVTVSGRLTMLNIDHWLNFLAHNTQNSDSWRSHLKELHLDVEHFTYQGYQLKPVSLELSREADAWRLGVEAKPLRGIITFPLEDSLHDMLDIQLEYLDLNALNEGYVGSGSVDPAELPAVRFFASKVLLLNWDLQQVNLSATPQQNGLKVHSLAVNDPDLNLRANGEWLRRSDGMQQTHVHINIDSQDIGKGMEKIGYKNLISEGTGSAEFDVSWADAPFKFDLGLLKGNATLAFREGQILDLEPGARGRVFGLISLQTIPKRLSLDFKDLTAKGFSFDKMRGDFTFASGEAYTNNFYIGGPIGRIDIVGRAGLLARDYDQNITFLPDLSSSLPVIGALLGGTTGGLTVIVVDRIARMFGKQTDHLGLVEYTVRGMWDNPKIEKVRRSKKDKNDLSGN